MEILIFTAIIIVSIALTKRALNNREGNLYAAFEILNGLCLIVLSLGLFYIILKGGEKLLRLGNFKYVLFSAIFSGLYLYFKYFEGHGGINEKQKNKEESKFLIEEAIELYNQRHYNQALDLYDRLIEMGFTSNENYESRAYTLFSLEYYLDAILDFDKAIIGKPTDANLYYCRAQCKQYTGDVYGAKDDYENAIEISKADSYENDLLHERAKKMHDSWQSATHVYESFYRGFLDDFNRLVKNNPRNSWIEAQRKKRRTAKVSHL